MKLFFSGSLSLFSAYSPSTSFPLRSFLLQFSQFSTSFSPNQYSYHSSSSSRRQEEESRNVKVSVWWDFENCNLPAGVNVFKVAHLITAAVRANGIKGPVQITAFGDILQLSRANQEALSATGISLTHIPNGGKNSADRSLLVDLMYWVSQNPPPAHLFLISGDRDFASILHRLRMNNYNVLLASPESAPSVLCSAASIMWHWNALIRGEYLVGKHFNQPPDGPYNSWYGHYKVPLQDPFPRNEQPSCSRVEEVSEPSSEPKPRPVPKTVIRQIRCLLKLYPKGISITEFRSELGKSNISMDKDYYGYKKFSRFLLSMPHILKIQTNSDGQLIVHIVTSRSVEPFESSRGSLNEVGNDTGEQDLNVMAKLKDNSSLAGDRPKNIQQSSEFGKSIGGAMIGDPSTPPVSELHVLDVSKQASKLEAESSVFPSIGQHSETEKGIFKRMWKRFFGSNDHNSENKKCIVSEKGYTSKDTSVKKSCIGLVTTYAGDNHGKGKTEEKTNKSTNQDASSVNPVSYSPANEAAMPQKTAIVSCANDDKSSSNPGLLGRIGQWFKFFRNDTENGKVSEPFCELNQLRNQSGKHELFSSSSFWQEVQSLMETPNAVELISQSKTRLEMAQSLQREGPSVLKSLSNSDLLDFVELLISEKKWVEECPSQTKPFKLTLSPSRKNSCSKPLRRSNGLTSIFLNTVSKPNSQGSPAHDPDKKNENTSQAGVSTTLTKSKYPDRTRSEILGDCQKLVNEILKEYPDGFNMGAFRRLFVERYEYHLDLQKLGYQKLASLLQIMPGVTIESTFIVPTSKAPKISNFATVIPSCLEEKVSHIVTNTDSESSEPCRKDDDFDSSWEELGPVACTNFNRNEEESLLSKGATEKRSRYEPALSDDDLTDSDGESLSTIGGSEVQEKQQIKEEDSSLLQILDSWYSNKEDHNRKDKSENMDENIDCSVSSLKLSSLSVKSEANVGSFSRKQRHQKSYSFVSDSDDNSKEKLIDGILGTLKKSTESRIHN